MTPMLEDDARIDEVDARIIPTPLCDDGLAEAAYEPEDEELGEEQVEAHGGGGFNDAS